MRTSSADALAQAPIAGSNIDQAGDCSDFLNDNVRDNLNGDVSDNDNRITVIDDSER
ncbi:hypothetical protein ACFU8R_06155 [Pseudonocardia alni]|uniref:hypothetical protein n=1 Tax=Pseudonocardia TaxID=1847 RepID=UPI00091A9FEB|nr:hypothetical protein [Pseudonocardia sp. SID8383]MYW72974.1 hypothetical protein [Pseudonocardia sp. SID8383]OJG06265.1 hypothetical protein BG618_02588 [Pseudonocardia autotrophica]